MSKREKVKGHTRRDGTKVKGYHRVKKRSSISQAKRRAGKSKARLALALRMGVKPYQNLALMKQIARDDRGSVGEHKNWAKYQKMSPKHRARSDKRTAAYHAKRYRIATRKRR